MYACTHRVLNDTILISCAWGVPLYAGNKTLTIPKHQDLQKKKTPRLKSPLRDLSTNIVPNGGGGFMHTEPHACVCQVWYHAKTGFQGAIMRLCCYLGISHPGPKQQVCYTVWNMLGEDGPKNLGMNNALPYIASLCPTPNDRRFGRHSLCGGWGWGGGWDGVGTSGHMDLGVAYGPKPTTTCRSESQSRNPTFRTRNLDFQV